jgi:hypothetical protein
MVECKEALHAQMAAAEDLLVEFRAEFVEVGELFHDPSYTRAKGEKGLYLRTGKR